jgi:hypothetical protein
VLDIRLGGAASDRVEPDLGALALAAGRPKGRRFRRQADGRAPIHAWEGVPAGLV